MPARPPPAPRRRPPRQIVRRRLPQNEIHRVFFVRRNFDPGARDHIIDRPARERAIGLIRPDTKQDMPLGDIGVTLGHQIFDHRHHGPDPFSGARHVVRLQRADRRHIVQIPARGFVGDVPNRPSGLDGTRVYLVIHIREVPHIGDMFGPVNMTQQPEQRIKHNHRTRIADMRAVIHRRATDIHPHIRGIDRIKPFFRTRRRVIKLDLSHGPSFRRKRSPARDIAWSE